MKQEKWDNYFMRIAKEVSSNSKCLSRKIGAVLVKDKAIISTGYNGPARGVSHCGERGRWFYDRLNGISRSLATGPDHKLMSCPRRVFGYPSGKGLHLCQAGHAERNALIQAARNGISTLGTTLYCYCGQVCKDCAIEIVNAGVSTLVFLKFDKNYDDYSEHILNESGIEIRRIDAEKGKERE